MKKFRRGTLISGLFLNFPICFASIFALIVLLTEPNLRAQTFTVLHSFTGTADDGASPQANLILSGNTLYGTAYGDQYYTQGNVFAVNTDGSGFTNLHTFHGDDGSYLVSGLILSGRTLYGVINHSDGPYYGSVFAVNTDSTGFTNLYIFNGESDGAGPVPGLVLSDNTLYGMTSSAGNMGFGSGTVFTLNTNSSDFTVLHTFSGDDGAQAYAGPCLSGDILYGTTPSGGPWPYGLGIGTVFSIRTDGTGFTNLYFFNGESDGSNPNCILVVTNNTLYGTTDSGTVFSIKTDGTGFTNLYNFTVPDPDTGTNNDGAPPISSLTLSGNTLYGTAGNGGKWGYGTIFAVNIDGTGFTNFYNFSGGDDGGNPNASLVFSSDTLYGTATSGGNLDNGIVFSFSLGSTDAPRLTINPSGTNVVLSWNTNANGFILQSTENFISNAVWNSVAPNPVAVDGQNTVTNLISEGQMFYRLFRSTH